MLKNNNQHRLGQHYSKEEELISNYNSILLKQKTKIIVDPFVGEGHLLFHYLNLFEFKIQKEILENKLIRGYDLFEKNILFIKEKMKAKYRLSNDLVNDLFHVRDSLLDTTLPKNTFILTNPPYLAKNVCKKNYQEDFKKYYLEEYKKENDYYEIALKEYSGYSGIWIVPSNLFSSDIMHKIRKQLILNLENIFIYQKKIFDDTDITVTTFFNNKNISSNKKKITFVNHTKTETNLVVSKDGNLSEEWDNIKLIKNNNNIKQGYIDNNIKEGKKEVLLLNTNYKEETFNITEEDEKHLKKNILILRTTDTGTEQGKLGLYTIEEIWGSKKTIGLVTKISSRVYTQLFFDLSINEQLILKDKFNIEINNLRKKYHSIFLTNYKNSSNGIQRKRITFKETFSLINKIINDGL
jgi:hypothetical protein